MSAIPAILLIVIGLLNCFFGYRIFMVLLVITGLLLGGIAGGAAGHAIGDGSAPVTVLGAVLGALIGAVLMVTSYLIGVFMVGAFAGAIAGTALSACFADRPEPVLLLILAIIGGVLALVIQKYVIIVATAFNGSFGVVLGVAHLFMADAIRLAAGRNGLRQLGGWGYILFLSWIALGIAGIIVQCLTTKDKPKADAGDHSPAPPPPAAEPAPVTPQEGGAQVLETTVAAECSNCGLIILDDPKGAPRKGPGMTACPQCGAKIDLSGRPRC